MEVDEICENYRPESGTDHCLVILTAAGYYKLGNVSNVLTIVCITVEYTSNIGFYNKQFYVITWTRSIRIFRIHRFVLDYQQKKKKNIFLSLQIAINAALCDKLFQACSR